MMSYRGTIAPALCLGLFAASACDPGKTDAAPQCESDSGADDADLDGNVGVPIAVDCSFVFAGVQTDVTYEVSEGEGERTETPVGGKLIAGGMLSDPEFESRTFSLVIYAEDGSVSTSVLYQMDSARLPSNEFSGDHGFTGLNAVRDPDAGESVQYACFARDPAEPPHAWEN